MTFAAEKTFTVEGIRIPETLLSFVRDNGSGCCSTIRAASNNGLRSLEKHRSPEWSHDRELLYAGAMFHDMGLTPAHSIAHERFEVDSANAARDFLRGHGIEQHDIDTV